MRRLLVRIQMAAYSTCVGSRMIAARIGTTYMGIRLPIRFDGCRCQPRRSELSHRANEDRTMQAELSIFVHHDFFKFILMPGFAIWLWMCWIAGRPNRNAKKGGCQ